MELEIICHIKEYFICLLLFDKYLENQIIPSVHVCWLFQMERNKNLWLLANVLWWLGDSKQIKISTVVLKCIGI